MKTEQLIQLRAFPVVLQDARSGEISNTTTVLTKEQLQAAQLVGQSSKELIYRLYNREGFRVLDIGKPDRKEVHIDLAALYEVHTRGDWSAE